jgi:hypothetical protein
MITVGTPGLGVRHPDGKSSGWKTVNVAPSRIGPMRVADAQTGRPYSNHFPILDLTWIGFLRMVPRPEEPTFAKIHSGENG